jgi:hypothetical protein
MDRIQAGIAAAAFAICCCGSVALAQDEPAETPLPHAQPLPPPASLRPGAAMDSDNGDPDARSLPQDKPIAMGNTQIVCTGTGSSKNDPRWADYPIRIEFSNGAAQYLSGMHITLTKSGGAQVGEFVCWAPWLLLRAPSGTATKVTASVSGDADSPVKGASFKVPPKGQKRVELAFPGMEANQ